MLEEEKQGVGIDAELNQPVMPAKKANQPELDAGPVPFPASNGPSNGPTALPPDVVATSNPVYEAPASSADPGIARKRTIHDLERLDSMPDSSQARLNSSHALGDSETPGMQDNIDLDQDDSPALDQEGWVTSPDGYKGSISTHPAGVQSLDGADHPGVMNTMSDLLSSHYDLNPDVLDTITDLLQSHPNLPQSAPQQGAALRPAGADTQPAALLNTGVLSTGMLDTGTDLLGQHPDYSYAEHPSNRPRGPQGELQFLHCSCLLKLPENVCESHAIASATKCRWHCQMRLIGHPRQTLYAGFGCMACIA